MSTVIERPVSKVLPAIVISKIPPGTFFDGVYRGHCGLWLRTSDATSNTIRLVRVIDWVAYHNVDSNEMMLEYRPFDAEILLSEAKK